MIWLQMAIAALILIPVGVVVLESLAALLPFRRSVVERGTHRPNCVVLVPAHNEEAGIGGTVARLRGQLRDGDRILVVADNCSDATAVRARAAGADVVERHDLDRRGKGFALDYGVRHLEAEPGDGPAVVVVLDADCWAEPGAIDALVGDAARSGGPVQAINVIEVAPDADARRKISALAFQVKNRVRPLGLTRLGSPCLLGGNGMALPWELIRRAKLAHGGLAEDMQLGVDLALEGSSPRLCRDAVVLSDSAPSARATAVQRTRWEHGHLRTLMTQVPRLAWAGIRQGRPSLWALALELSVPPLSMLVMAWVAAVAVTGALWPAGGSPWPFAVLVVGGLVAVVTGVAVWLRFGRQVVPAGTLAALPVYVAWKLPIYLAFIASRQRTWVRTERAPTPAE